jgi:hypothetical protein
MRTRISKEIVSKKKGTVGWHSMQDKEKLNFFSYLIRTSQK